MKYDGLVYAEYNNYIVDEQKYVMMKINGLKDSVLIYCNSFDFLISQIMQKLIAAIVLR